MNRTMDVIHDLRCMNHLAIYGDVKGPSWRFWFAFLWTLCLPIWIALFPLIYIIGWILRIISFRIREKKVNISIAQLEKYLSKKEINDLMELWNEKKFKFEKWELILNKYNYNNWCDLIKERRSWIAKKIDPLFKVWNESFEEIKKEPIKKKWIDPDLKSILNRAFIITLSVFIAYPTTYIINPTAANILIAIYFIWILWVLVWAYYFWKNKEKTLIHQKGRQWVLTRIVLYLMVWLLVLFVFVMPTVREKHIEKYWASSVLLQK